MEEGIDFVDYSKPENLPTLTDGDVALGDGHRFMIKRSQIPEVDVQWNQLFSKYFFGIGEDKEFVFNTKNCYTEEENYKFLKFIRSVSKSFAPKHQHKEHFVAYLFSLWLDSYKIRKVGKSKDMA
jgi:hypothetical protein